MIIKRVSLFIAIFLISCAVLFIFRMGSNEDNKGYYLLDEYKIDSSSPLTVTLLNDLDKKTNKNILYRIKFTESDELVNTIKIFRNSLFDNKGLDSGISIDNNTITTGDYLGPVKFFITQNFITNIQFDHSYFETISAYVYEIHIPEGMDYRIN